MKKCIQRFSFSIFMQWRQRVKTIINRVFHRFLFVLLWLAKSLSADQENLNRKLFPDKITTYFRLCLFVWHFHICETALNHVRCSFYIFSMRTVAWQSCNYSAIVAGAVEQTRPLHVIVNYSCTRLLGFSKDYCKTIAQLSTTFRTTVLSVTTPLKICLDHLKSLKTTCN